VKGSERSKTPSTILKAAMFAPMPRAKVRIATSVKPGVLSNIRQA